MIYKRVLGALVLANQSFAGGAKPDANERGELLCCKRQDAKDGTRGKEDCIKPKKHECEGATSSTGYPFLWQKVICSNPDKMEVCNSVYWGYMQRKF